jgi:hypothetical protein
VVAVTVGVSTSRSGWGHGHGQHWVAIGAVGRQEAAADPSVTGAGNTAAGVRPVATGKVQGGRNQPSGVGDQGQWQTRARQEGQTSHG